jgi:hypothetical protein
MNAAETSKKGIAFNNNKMKQPAKAGCFIL